MTPRLRKFTFSLGVFVVSLALCDVVLRWIPGVPKPTGLLMWSRNFQSYYGLRPHYKEALYRINSQSLRGPEIHANELQEKHVILCLGDSTTFGLGVKEEEAYPS